MKISPVTVNNKTKKIIKNLKYSALILPVVAGIQVSRAQDVLPAKDTYQVQDSIITQKGIDITTNLLQAPNPTIKIGNEIYFAGIVVDINNNTLYLYDALGLPQKAYKIASGKASTPTHTGIKKITNIEMYPYKSAPYFTKRYKNPDNYGPRLLLLSPVDINTGKLLPNDGQFIHGTNNPESIGKYVSKGCIRMDNDAIKEVASYVQKGQYVSIIR